MIVGATSSIDRAAALLFTKEDAKIAVVGQRTELLDALCSEIEQEGVHAIMISADVTKAQEIARKVNETLAVFSKLDFAFNNAGTIGNVVPMLKQSEQDWDHTIDTNLKSVWLSVREQAKAMKGTGGAIVNTSS